MTTIQATNALESVCLCLSRTLCKSDMGILSFAIEGTIHLLGWAAGSALISRMTQIRIAESCRDGRRQDALAKASPAQLNEECYV